MSFEEYQEMMLPGPELERDIASLGLDNVRLIVPDWGIVDAPCEQEGEGVPSLPETEDF